MLDLKEAVRIEDYLKASFANVHMKQDPVTHEVSIHAKHHDRMPPITGCPHTITLLSTNITAVISRDAYLVNGREPVLFDYVKHCSRCGKVKSAKVHGMDRDISRDGINDDGVYASAEDVM